jgi:hypothetical protein
MFVEWTELDSRMLSWNTSQREGQTKDVLWRDFWMDEGGRNRPGGLTPWRHYDDYLMGLLSLRGCTMTWEYDVYKKFSNAMFQGIIYDMKSGKDTHDSTSHLIFSEQKL